MGSNRTSSKHFTPAEQAILTTILYSSLFSFPLKTDELWKLLISDKKISQKDFEFGLSSLKEIILRKDGFFCLKSNETTVDQRKKQLPEVSKKMKRAKWIASKLSVLPSIVFIGISGGLAIKNVTKKDDIDLVIIVKENTLFVSRLFILAMLQLLGVRRWRGQKETADTICVNLLFDTTALGWFGTKQDVYTAREIAQLVPLFERDATYRKFITANSWIQHFLPNITLLSSLRKQGSKKQIYRDSRFHGNDNLGIKIFSFFFFNPVFESICRILQMNWMKRHQTNETVTNHLLALHPNDYRIKILAQLRLKMRQFGLLTKF